MKTAVIYTVISLLNLIGFLAGTLTLPAVVPIHFDLQLTADTVGSPWVFLALPAASALISAGVWAAVFSAKMKRRALVAVLLSALGAVFAYLGWIFFALVSGGAGIGEKTEFPLALSIVLPLSLLLIFLGTWMPSSGPAFGIRALAPLGSEKAWKDAGRLGGALFLAAGILSAAGAVALTCVPGGLGAWSALVLAGTALAACAVTAVYTRLLLKRTRGEEPAGEHTEP